jgi:phosphate-selective porin OprO/OprP
MPYSRFFILFIFFYVIWCPTLSIADENVDNHTHPSIAYDEEDGFSLIEQAIESLNFGGWVEIDGRFFVGENQPKSTFLVRRARLFMTGTLYKVFGFMVMPRWDRQERIDLHYAWIETLYPLWARVRVGLFKKPFSLEALKSDLFRNFVEVSLIVRNFLRVVDIGVMGFGQIISDRLEYGIGFFNGRGRELDNNNNKEIVGRLVYQIVKSSTLGDLYVGYSGATGRFDEDLSGKDFVTETFTPFWQWSDNSKHPVENHSTHVHWGIDMEWYVGPFYFCTEILYTNWGHIRMGDRSRFFKGYGGYVEFTYLLTGEDKPRLAPLFPKHNFDPCKDEWGAWEVGARYEVFYASKSMITSGFASGANYLHGPILALNWYLNPRMEIRFDAQHLWFNRAFILKSHKFRNESNFICRATAVF